MTALAAALVLLPAGAHAATSPAATGVSVTSLVVAADYKASHTVYAVGSRTGCTSDCVVLLRSRDGGGSWGTAGGDGWQHGEVIATTVQGRAALLSAAGSSGGFDLSFDQGQSFHPVAAPGTLTGSPTGVALDGAVTDVILSGGDGASAHLDPLPAGSAQPVPGDSGLQAMTVIPAPVFPHAPAGVPAAIALGVDKQTNSARLDWCDNSLKCTSTTPLTSGGKLSFSPNFAHDLTLFFLGPKGLQRSTDGGRTLVPVTVMASGPDTLVTTVTALATTDDFDASAGHGTVFAAVVSASKANHGTLSGGVYRSSDGGVTWKPSGSASSLQQGAAAVALAPDGRLFAGTLHFGNEAGGVYCSTDTTSWNPTCPAYPSAAHDSGVSAGNSKNNAAAGKGTTPGGGATAAPVASSPGATGAGSGVGTLGDAAHQPPGSSSSLSPARLVLLLVAVGLALSAVVARLRRRRRVDAEPTTTPPAG